MSENEKNTNEADPTGSVRVDATVRRSLKHFMVWMPWVHFWIKPMHEKGVSNEIWKWLIFEVYCDLVYVSHYYFKDDIDA